MSVKLFNSHLSGFSRDLRGKISLIAVWIFYMCALVLPLAGGEFVVVSPQSSPAVVIRPDAWKPLVGFKSFGLAAYGGPESEELLIRTVKKITARELPVFSESKAPANSAGPRIYLGRSKAIEEAFGKKLDSLDIDGFIVELWQGNLVLAGRNDRGTFFAVTDFLRRECGCEWYLPGEIGEVIPRSVDLVVQVGDRQEEPDCKHRFFWLPVTSKLGEKTGESWREKGDETWFVNIHRWHKRHDWHHALNKLLPVSKYGKEHPEYFPEFNGKRRVPTSLDGWQPCMTSREGIKAVADGLVAQFRKEPDLPSASVSVNDGGGFCRCTECSKLVLTGDEAKQCGANARLYYTYINKIAELVAAECPDKKLCFLSYTSSRLPPPDIKLHPMLVSFVVPGGTFNLRNQKFSDDFNKEMEFWLGIMKNIGIHDWVYGSENVVPIAQYHQLSDFYKKWYPRGLQDVYFESGPNWGLDGHKYALLMAILWNLDTDVDQWLKKFYAEFFGKAAEPMAEYDRLMEKTWWDQKSRPGLWKREQFDGFTPEVVEQARALLLKAQSQAKTAIAFQRVEMYRQAFEGSAIYIMRDWHMRTAGEDLAKNDLRATVKHLVALSDPKLDSVLYYDTVLTNAPISLMKSPTERRDFKIRLEYPGAIVRNDLIRMLTSELIESPRSDLNAATMAEKVTSSLAELCAGQDLDNNARFIFLSEMKIMGGKVAGAKRWEGAKPVCDGDLGEPFWKQAPVQEDFQLFNGKLAHARTQFQAAYDDECLYLACTAWQDTSELVKNSEEAKGDIWHDDAVEFFVYGPSGDKPDWLQVIVNAFGEVYKSLDGDAKWSSNLKSGVKILPDRYVVELAIPWSDTKHFFPAATPRLRLNLLRDHALDWKKLDHNYVTLEGLNWYPYKEMSFWYPRAGTNQFTQTGWLVLKK